MFDIKMFKDMSTKDRLENMVMMLEGLVSGDELALTKLCNASALISALITRVNWCGFYLVKEDELVLGPFQGMPACTKIQIGKGVCGTAAQNKETLLIKNVHEFEGHIACDAASNSEIVVPIVKDGVLYGVLDLDSDEFERFSDVEKLYLEKAIEVLNNHIDWNNIL